MEGPIFGGTYLRGEIYVAKSIGLAYTWKANKKKLYVTVPFALFYFAFEGNFKVQATGGSYSGGRFNGRFSCASSFEGLYLEGLIHGGTYFRNFTGHRQ